MSTQEAPSNRWVRLKKRLRIVRQQSPIHHGIHVMLCSLVQQNTPALSDWSIRQGGRVVWVCRVVQTGRPGGRPVSV